MNDFCGWLDIEECRFISLNAFIDSSFDSYLVVINKVYKLWTRQLFKKKRKRNVGTFFLYLYS